MLNFFEPQSKIQKNRQVLRETDERMAKYSRRGLLSNFIIFLLCMMVGEFMDRQPLAAITLTIGLLITTLLRGYLLFRFDQLYPKAPQLWRTRYFYATLLGATWWSLIVCFETLSVGINHEGPLLWLYTIVFFSMTANALSPYKQFLSLYQFIGLVPGAICLLFTNDFTAIIYAIVVFFFIWLLHHQCVQMADNYWMRLEASHALALKTESLESEKRDTHALVQLHRDYMFLLRKELEELLQAKRSPRNDEPATHPQAIRRPKLDHLYRNVNDFYQILIKEVDFKPRLFNPLAFIMHQVRLWHAESLQKGITLDATATPTLPLLVEGDAERLGHILHSMLGAVIQQLQQGVLLLDIEYIQERGKVGELILTLDFQYYDNKTLFNHNHILQLNLDLALATGMSELMGGALEITSNQHNTQIRFRAKYPSHTEAPDINNTRFQGKSVLLIHESPKLLDYKRQALSLLGLAVSTESQYKKALGNIKKAVSESAPLHAIIFHASHEADETLKFSQELAGHEDLKQIPQILCGDTDQFDPETLAILHEKAHLNVLSSPWLLADMEMQLWLLFQKPYQGLTPSPLIALIGNDASETLIESLTAQGLTCESFTTTKALIAGLDKIAFQAILVWEPSDVDLGFYQQLKVKRPQLALTVATTANRFEAHLAAGADHCFAAGISKATVADYFTYRMPEMPAAEPL
jgi:two-component system, sensor histidine kinase RetS